MVPIKFGGFSLRARLCLSMLCLALSFLTGCQTKMEYWINPDGTGKVTVDYVAQALDGPTMAMLDAEAVLLESKGVRQWADVSYKYETDHFALHATAYFDNVNQFQLGRLFALRPTVTFDAGKIASIAFDPSDIQQNASGAPAAQPATARLTPEQVKAKALELRRMERLTGVGFRKSRIEHIVHLPGKATDLNNLEPTPDGGVRLVLDGARYADAHMQVISDPELLSRVIEAGEDPTKPGGGKVIRGILIEKTLGKPGGIVATVGDDPKRPATAALFDYKAEVKKNAAEYADVVAKAGLQPTMPQVNAENALVSLEAEPIKTRSMSRRVSFNIKGETVTPFFRATRGILVKLTDENGKPVPFGPGNGRIVQTSSPGLVDLKPVTQFMLTLWLPKGHSLFKEIKGSFGIITGDSAEEVDLGIVDLKTGAKGSGMGFTFADVSNAETTFQLGNGPPVHQVNTTITATLDRNTTPIRIKLLEPEGKDLISWEIDPNRLERTYRTQTNLKFPDKVRVKVVTLKNARTIDVPFEFDDVPAEEAKP